MEGKARHFDVFISCHMTTKNGQPTHDSLLAKEIYKFLTSRGIRTFLAEESLKKMGKTEYKEVIDNVLDHVPILIVVATSTKNIESKWVKYEWNSFYNDILSGVKKGTLMSYLDNVDTKVLPRTLRQCQAIQHSDSSIQILLMHISSALGLKQVEDMTRSGQFAIDKLNKLTEIMAESRLLELEMTLDRFEIIFSSDQRARMQNHIDSLKSILKEQSNQEDV